ncbi:MAG: hypothetical protein EOP04_11205, partial [Proteobacteria bacterium]
MLKKELHTILEIKKRVNGRVKTCLVSGCEEPAINTHVLQQNGILNHIAQNGHVVQLHTERLFDESIFRFQKKSIAKAEALTFKGLCSRCDNRIFETIEKFEPNFYDYKTQLLFSYRALLRQQYDVIETFECYQEFKKSKDLSPHLKAFMAPAIKRMGIVTDICNYYLQLMESEKV